VVKPKHPDFTTEAQRHEDEGEIASPGLPIENSEEPLENSFCQELWVLHQPEPLGREEDI